MTTAAVPDLGPALRILVVTPRYLPLLGGTEVHTRETSVRIASAGHQVTVLTADAGEGLAAEECRDGVHVVRVPAWPRQRDYYLAPQLTRVIQSDDWDLIHVQGVHTLFPPLAMWSAARRRIPFVLSFHSGGSSSRLRTRLRGVHYAALRSLLARAHRLICVSQFEAEFFRRRLRLPPNRFVVIPNGADLSETPNDLTGTSSVPLITSVGRLEKYKGHHRVIEALPYVRARRPEARLRILGQGPYEPQLRRLADRLNVASYVEIGALPPSDRSAIAGVLAESSVVVLLSDYESQGIAAHEAVQLKRPLLVANSSALHELAERGLAREVSPKSSPSQIADAILDQLDRPLIPAGVNLPTWDECADLLLNLYQCVARKQPCAS
jgi:glycosyltransferase involved in cell wall biosynthesis